MNNMIPQNRARQLQVGDLVRLPGGRVTWEVTKITPVAPEVAALNPTMPDDPYVGIRSTRTGCHRTTMAGRLRWADTGEPAWTPRRGPSFLPHATDPEPRGLPDDLSDVVVTWAGPVLDGDRQDPSAVTVCVTVDDIGERFLRLAADGPDGTAWVSKDAARDLALAILNQLRHMA